MKKMLLLFLAGLPLMMTLAQVKKPTTVKQPIAAKQPSASKLPAAPVAPAEEVPAPKLTLPRPKLVVGIMIDQMRWDYLYRFYHRYGSKGFRRLMQEGMNCENAMIPYAQTVTAVGHTSVYTGSVPALHGMMGNEWYDKKAGRMVYCAEDTTVKIVGAAKGEPMSPANMWANTICDELRLATNFQSKVIGIAIKDRGGILPAGHMANAAYWYDGSSGDWITSTYYMNQLPNWVQSFNQKKYPDSLQVNHWNTLYPIESYTQSDNDHVAYEGKFAHEAAPVFPHELRSRVGKDYGTIRATPFGTTLTLKFAAEALKREDLGADAVTDFLALSLSSPDYTGHQFGPNSIEIEDTYLRLDQDLGEFLDLLDREVGKGQYAVFLTADHAVAHVPAFLKEHKQPAQSLTNTTLTDLNNKIATTFKLKDVLVASANYQYYLNDTLVEKSGVDEAKLRSFIVRELNKNPEVLIAFDNRSIEQVNLPASVREMFIKGYNAKRAGDFQVVLKSGNFYGAKTGTTHGSYNPYDAHIPLLWMGWGIKKGTLNREVYMTDIAVTLAALLHIQMPNAAVGHVIPEVLQ